ncbi:MAG: TspO/MBR family protein [Thermoanaerobaculia bacterium]
MKNISKFIISILIPLIIGFFGSIFTSTSVSTWYPTLNKPSFNPPNWIFGPVWTTLYILMGISFYLIWKKTNFKENRTVFIFFFIQLFFNLSWSFFFFTLKSPFLALIDIILLLIFIIFTILSFYKISKVSSYLLLPCLFWVLFATILNFSILILN